MRIAGVEGRVAAALVGDLDELAGNLQVVPSRETGMPNSGTSPAETVAVSRRSTMSSFDDHTRVVGGHDDGGARSG